VSRHFFPLSAVTARIEEILAPAARQRFWVRAELSGASERNHFYCDLVETDEAGRTVARLRCQIWARDLARIRERFKAAGLDLVLENGTQVGLQCELRFHPVYGLSLVGRDMDPAFALGELELRRRRILETLEREGLFGRNAERPLPLLPNRVGLVTSGGSAACSDFVETLAASGFGFRVLLAGATMQGEDTRGSVCAALDALSRLPLDLVVVARGGGSRSDLAWLDDETLARRIAAFPVPVWTGIGHETDQSVLDAVAARSWKTPTAVAEALVDRFDRVALRLRDGRSRLRSVWLLRSGAERQRTERARNGIRQGARKLLQQRRSDLLRGAERVRGRVGARLGRERGRLEQARGRLRVCARGIVSTRQERLAAWVQRLRRGSRAARRLARERLARQRGRLSLRRIRQRLAVERTRLSTRQQVLRAADPRTALGRGFSLTRRADGTLLRAVGDVAPGERILTRLGDGELESVVETARRTGGGEDG